MVHSTRIDLLAASATVAFAALAISACGSGGGSSPASAAPTTASGSTATLGVATGANLGEILVDSQGRSLYLFRKDAGTKSECAGACAAVWPPLRATGKPVIGDRLAASKVGTTARADGQPQVTYNGHPLYRYSADQKPGDTNGQGLTTFGGGWFALSAGGNMVSGTGSNGGSANGY